MFVCILGRQPEISLAELEAVYGKSSVDQVAKNVATVETPLLNLEILGGTLKCGRVVEAIKTHRSGSRQEFVSISRKITNYYLEKWKSSDRKITLGISAYGFDISPRDVQKTGLILKSNLKKLGVSLRLVPNIEPALSTAVSHNNKLGLSDNKVEIMIIHARDSILIAESCGAQNISAYSKRDQNRPKRDAFVGMLPPKLAQIMLNLAVGNSGPDQTILDPFCGTGTVLQEALLRNFKVIGSDLNPKMIDYTKRNLDWLIKTHRAKPDGIIDISEADAMTNQWTNAKNITAVVCEAYLGQPFSAPPSPEKLKEVSRNCNHIISEFLKNIHPQISPNTKLCIAVPAWQDKDGRLTHLPLINKLDQLGYKNVLHKQLIYRREDQIVAREILALDVII